MDPANSIILSPTFDKLFDKGFITFLPENGHIKISEKEENEFYNDIDRLGITGNERLSILREDTSKYLIYQQNNIFQFHKTKEIEAVKNPLVR